MEDIETTTIINREIEEQRKKKLNLRKNRRFVVNLIKRHTRSDYDYVILCSGPEGEGKSANVIQVGFEVMGIKSRVRKRKFIRKNIIYDPTSSELFDKINNAKQNSVIIIDEAMEAIYKRNYNLSIQKKINILFSKIRRKNLVIFFCIPDFFDIDKYFRQHRVKSWFYTPMRGLGIVFKKSNSPFSEDKWYQRANQRSIEVIEQEELGNRLANKSEMVAILRRLKNYGIEYKFDDFDKDIKEDYLKFKEWGGTTKPRESIEHIEDKASKIRREASINLIKMGISNKKIAEALGLHVRTVIDYTKRIREQLRKEKKEREKESPKEGSEREKPAEATLL